MPRPILLLQHTRTFTHTQNRHWVHKHTHTLSVSAIHIYRRVSTFDMCNCVSNVMAKLLNQKLPNWSKSGDRSGYSRFSWPNAALSYKTFSSQDKQDEPYCYWLWISICARLTAHSSQAQYAYSLDTLAFTAMEEKQKPHNTSDNRLVSWTWNYILNFCC